MLLTELQFPIKGLPRGKPDHLHALAQFPISLTSQSVNFKRAQTYPYTIKLGTKQPNNPYVTKLS